ncbi:MutS family protein MSH4 NDAI_0G03360 [Naumovozyma dairenensis CBS 421]|uniref:DNA mismatch repair proteins mutS family domain-containing protein n=1 Tax=Naumovozyma dairenensis (strain ATCC 10597 / BCRC 20456 / CBS 421 / NBRC 0211 / NRRL Y-12639) TaxID=1071378 RepID=G0WEA2_NAUDC|nr:hypothetical protein NDAI_0G03360 [Naumovozyma dairenensis CBS 421]CCD26113.2 hypothetical protein NDAI_0G03360 [Naumovozyma dairenensis CBS 421]
MDSSDLSTFVSAHYFSTSKESRSTKSSGIATSAHLQQFSIQRQQQSRLSPKRSLPWIDRSFVKSKKPSTCNRQPYFSIVQSHPNSLLPTCYSSNAQSYSTGTTTRTVTRTSGPERILCCLYEIPKEVETRVGLCFLNYSTGKMILSDFMDSQIFIRTVHKIQIHQPTELLLPSSSLSPNVSKLATILKFNISETVKISEASSKFFDPHEGLAAISKYAIKDKDDTEEHVRIVEELIDKTFALSATAASIKYTDELVNKSSNTLSKFKNLRISYEGTENTMLIDPKTSTGLELVENKIDKNGLSFWKFLNTTSTKMGARSLRNNILQPLTDKSSILMRLDVIKELQKDKDFLISIRREMKLYQDLDKLFSKLLSVNHAAIKPEQKINYILLLKDSISITLTLKKLLEEVNLESQLLQEAKKIFNNTSILEIENDINEYINEDSVWASSCLELKNQQSYAVKGGANGLLGVSRQLYRSSVDSITDEIEELSKKYDLPIDYNFDSFRGFYLKIKKQAFPELNEVPNIFINVVSKKNFIECTTMDILKENAKLKEIISEISMLSEQAIHELLDKIAKNISVLFMISEAVSILDLLCCFAHNSLKHNYCIPKFSSNLILKEARHPILETQTKNFVPNDITNTKNTSSVQIITGCNGSGKSVYLRQIALLSIMAQMGSPVPATGACFPIFSKLHARVCNDPMEMSSSTFSFEMKEMAYFLDDMDDTTLLILDELGRGSSIGDGFSISLAITEYLIQKKSNVFLSTHFKDIPAILTSKPNVVHLHMQSQLQWDNSMKMLYHVGNEVDDIENIGIKLVSKYFDPDIVTKAYAFSSVLKAAEEKATNGSLLGEEKEKEKSGLTS